MNKWPVFMNRYFKYGLVLIVFFIAQNMALANAIDSIVTKEDLQKFLTAKFEPTGLVWGSYTSLTGNIKRKRLTPDTTIVMDPETQKELLRITPPDTSQDFEATYGRSNYRYDNETKRLVDSATCTFFKQDIDRDGRTDMLVDAGLLIIIVMDLGERFEGYVLFNGIDSALTIFRGFCSMPDGSKGILMWSDHNPWSSKAHTVPHGVSSQVTSVNYITDTVVSKPGVYPSLKIDTLYKITNVLDSESRRIKPGSWERKKVACKYADTVDLRLYNMTDTMVYKFGGLAHYNSHFKPAGISRIEYYYLLSAGLVQDGYDCIQINSNRQCYLQYRERDGYFEGTIDNKSFHELVNFISYINIKSLKNKYINFATDGDGAGFAIYFDDGTSKKIEMSRYYVWELGSLSKNIAEISKKIEWHPSAKPADFKCPCEAPLAEKK